MRSLVVEDDPVSRALMVEVLEKHGEVVTAEDGTKAIETVKQALAAETPFDLICLDIMLPEMDGHEVLARIRELEAEDGKGGETKIIFISALNDSENIVRAYCGRCACYLVKPIDVNELYGHLRSLGLIEASS